MMNMTMKRALRYTLLGGVLLLPAFALAQGFVPLTNIPEIRAASESGDLTDFLNALYRICIGIAVVLAVLQLVRAGITYMTAAGSVGSTEEAKHLISTSLLGLLLVLSPYIVFSVINPAILTLNLDTSDLQIEEKVNSTPATDQAGGAAEQITATGPGAPKDLRVTGQTATSVTITWNASRGATPTNEYEVYQGGALIKKAQTTSVTVTGLKTETPYSFSVKAVAADGKTSAASESLSVTLTETVPEEQKTQWSWRAKFLNWASQGAFDAGQNGSGQEYSGGPFTSAAACDASYTKSSKDYRDKIEANSGGKPVFDTEVSCSCSKPIAEQGSSCPGK